MAYFHVKQVKEATAFANAEVGNGQPLNIIGHSMGAAAAVEVARGVNGTVNNLVAIDPVGSPGRGDNGPRPENVGNIVVVMALPSERNSSDTIASVGRFAWGIPETYTDSANMCTEVDENHGECESLYEAPVFEGASARDIVDQSYYDILSYITNYDLYGEWE